MLPIAISESLSDIYLSMLLHGYNDIGIATEFATNSGGIILTCWKRFSQNPNQVSSQASVKLCRSCS